MIEEKREFPRKSTTSSTNLLDLATKNILGDCILTDVSKNGFAIETETTLKIGQQFKLELLILDKKVSLSGEVVRMADGFFYPLYGAKIIDKRCINLNFFREYVEYSLN